MREEDGFQEGRRKGETRPRQTSEGKQKLMKQDVTNDGSLHPSKHGTLAGPALPLLFSFCLPLRLAATLFPLSFTVRLCGDYPRGAANHCGPVSQNS